MTPLNKKGYRIIFLVTVIFGVYFETIVFFYFQSIRISKILIDDFRVIAALRKNPDYKSINEGLSRIKGIKSVKFIEQKTTLEKIEKEDKELYLSIKSMASNPVPEIVEIEIYEEAIGNMDILIEDISKVKDIIDIRYKPDEAIAIMHLMFYSKLLFLVIGATILIVGVMVFAGAAYVGFSNFFNSVRESFKWFLNGMFGALVSVIFIYLAVYPVKYISQVWRWPEQMWHVITLLFGGFMGWVLYQWKKN
ncbi:MAG: hypothetical protein K6357_08610 [Elusimicrobiota bacterium]